MFPHYNSLPSKANANPSSSAPQLNQQVMANPGCFAPNTRQHPQMGMPNPQTAIPFSCPNAPFVPHQFLPMQAPQNYNNPNPINQLNNINAPNLLAQFLNQNSLNPPQYMNQNLNLGLGFPNPLLPLHLQNLNAQAGAGNINLSQALAFLASNQLGFGNSSGVNLNAMNQAPNSFQTVQPVQVFAPFTPQQNANNFKHPHPKSQGNNRNNGKMNRSGRNLQKKNFPSNPKHEVSLDRFTNSQVNNFQNTKGNFRTHPMQSRKGNDNDVGSKTVVVNSARQDQAVQKRLSSLMYTKHEIQQWREERRKNYPTRTNIEKKLAEKLKEPGTADLDAKRRRQQLKEILAKQAELGCEVAEIPACYLSDSEKQVHGNKDNGRSLSEKVKFQRKDNGRAFIKKEKLQRNGDGRAFSKNEKFQKPNKRGRFNQGDDFSKRRNSDNNGDASGSCGRTDHDLAKKQRVGNDDSVINYTQAKREPTLLKKLLNGDIRRDKNQLLQAFRFMVMNSFFKDWPQHPLKFPLVVVKEDALTDGKSKDISEEKFQELEESTGSDHDDNNNVVEEYPKVQAGEPGLPEDGIPRESLGGEDGEIIN